MATKPKAASTAATEANAVAEEVESPQLHEALPIAITHNSPRERPQMSMSMILPIPVTPISIYLSPIPMFLIRPTNSTVLLLTTMIIKMIVPGYARSQ
jgi:hypothetical protein